MTRWLRERLAGIQPTEPERAGRIADHADFCQEYDRLAVAMNKRTARTPAERVAVTAPSASRRAASTTAAGCVSAKPRTSRLSTTAAPTGTSWGARTARPAREISCADASLAEERRRRREAGITVQASRVPAAPVRAHVQDLMAGGMTVLAIADGAGVSKTGVKILIYGRSGARKGELPKEIEETKAQRILALHPAEAALGTFP